MSVKFCDQTCHRSRICTGWLEPWGWWTQFNSLSLGILKRNRGGLCRLSPFFWPLLRCCLGLSLLSGRWPLQSIPSSSLLPMHLDIFQTFTVGIRNTGDRLALSWIKQSTSQGDDGEAELVPWRGRTRRTRRSTYIGYDGNWGVWYVYAFTKSYVNTSKTPISG